MRRIAPRFLLASLSLWAAPCVVGAEPVEFTDDFRIEACRFSDSGANLYFIALEAGTQLVLEGDDDGELLHLEITVLRDRRSITFETGDGETISVRTRVIEEREWIDDELVEVSRNFFALCTQTSDVYYFGEEVDIYEDGEIVSHDGAWLAGVDGAVPGIIMPGTFLLGSRYYQELAPGVALDRAEHVETDLEVELPAGDFEDCVEVVETSPLEPGHESTKIYCPGIGLVVDNEAQLVEYTIDDDDGGPRHRFTSRRDD